MKTIADFKRKMTVGAKVTTVYHQAFAGRDEKTGAVIYKDENKGEREVSIVYSNAFALKTVKTDGTTADSWCNWPRASKVQFSPDGNSITLLEPDYRVRENPPLIPILTYSFNA
jgi:hypothetical protein